MLLVLALCLISHNCIPVHRRKHCLHLVYLLPCCDRTFDRSASGLHPQRCWACCMCFSERLSLLRETGWQSHPWNTAHLWDLGYACCLCGAARIVRLNRKQTWLLIQSITSLICNAIKCGDEFLFISVIFAELLVRKYRKTYFTLSFRFLISWYNTPNSKKKKKRILTNFEA